MGVRAMVDLDFAVEAPKSSAYAAIADLALRVARRQCHARRSAIENVMLQLPDPDRAGAPALWRAPSTERLADLFGEPERWGQTLAELSVDPCERRGRRLSSGARSSICRSRAASTSMSRRPNISMASSEATSPLALLFSGSVFYRDADGDRCRSRRSPWSKEAPSGCPIALWRRDDGSLLSATGLAAPAPRRCSTDSPLQAATRACRP